ncbi:hypothetical protein E2F43_03730 [Seongchinamella unica]|uniref:Uncharacterized protein n=1 Tax=Seongchinamella unica TaxID=2547392 RepID=A0A4R5LV90_9GAMM|nr:hypothetical protein [Seongchinamella unica]TDG15354.1 hypothetical protein E2F43_03730 [Seongchinamella unica]
MHPRRLAIPVGAGSRRKGFLHRARADRQALLHHFGNKEKLYSEVLLRVARQRQATIREIPNGDLDSARHLEERVLVQPALARMLGPGLLEEIRTNHEQGLGHW